MAMASIPICDIFDGLLGVGAVAQQARCHVPGRMDVAEMAHSQPGSDGRSRTRRAVSHAGRSWGRPGGPWGNRGQRRRMRSMRLAAVLVLTGFSGGFMGCGGCSPRTASAPRAEVARSEAGVP